MDTWDPTAIDAIDEAHSKVLGAPDLYKQDGDVFAQAQRDLAEVFEDMVPRAFRADLRLLKNAASGTNEAKAALARLFDATTAYLDLGETVAQD